MHYIVTVWLNRTRITMRVFGSKIKAEEFAVTEFLRRNPLYKTADDIPRLPSYMNRYSVWGLSDSVQVNMIEVADGEEVLDLTLFEHTSRKITEFRKGATN